MTPEEKERAERAMQITADYLMEQEMAKESFQMEVMRRVFEAAARGDPPVVFSTRGYTPFVECSVCGLKYLSKAPICPACWEPRAV
jgi:primosomal protein N'